MVYAPQKTSFVNTSFGERDFCENSIELPSTVLSTVLSEVISFQDSIQDASYPALNLFLFCCKYGIKSALEAFKGNERR